LPAKPSTSELLFAPLLSAQKRVVSRRDLQGGGAGGGVRGRDARALPWRGSALDQPGLRHIQCWPTLSTPYIGRTIVCTTGTNMVSAFCGGAFDKRGVGLAAGSGRLPRRDLRPATEGRCHGRPPAGVHESRVGSCILKYNYGTREMHGPRVACMVGNPHASGVRAGRAAADEGRTLRDPEVLRSIHYSVSERWRFVSIAMNSLLQDYRAPVDKNFTRGYAKQLLRAARPEVQRQRRPDRGAVDLAGPGRSGS
jgi:hypothetical protein